MPYGEHHPLVGYPIRSDEEMIARARGFADEMRTRRTVRSYAPRQIAEAVVRSCLEVALSAPNGANRQPWHFVAITDPGLKRQIREAAEEEERRFYGGGAPQEWLDALAPLGTDADKPFLEEAPLLVAIFAESYELRPDGTRVKNYYVQESVGIATGMLITAFHHAGLATLTHTPSPMRFLNDLLGRPYHERPFLLLVVGHPAQDATVPAITKKPFASVVTFARGS
ncbi:MAG: nitroreductase family protein [Gemmatimonadota bacterium]